MMFSRFILTFILSSSMVFANTGSKGVGPVPAPAGGGQMQPAPADLSPSQPQAPGQVTPNPMQTSGQISSGPQPTSVQSAPPLEMAGGDLILCPIIGREAETRRNLAPSADVIRAEIARVIQEARGSSNPQCRTLGTSLTPLLSGFSGGAQATCVTQPATCQSILDQVLPMIESCTENRGNIIDMVSSVALNLTAGSPLGLVTLGVTAFRSIINLFRGRSERESQRNEARRVAQQRRDVIEAAASCAMMTFYQVSICTPGTAGNIRDILDRANPSPNCTNRTNLGTMTQTQLVTSMASFNSCMNGDVSRIEQCGGQIGQQFSPAIITSAPAGERAACLVEESLSLASNVRNYRERDIPDFLKMARRHHTRQIMQLRNRLAASQPGDYGGDADRHSLVLHCFYGKMSRTISDRGPEREFTPAELAAQDRDDTRDNGVLEGVPQNELFPLARDSVEVENICSRIDNCAANVPQAPTIAETFGPEGGSVSQRMCNGVQQFLEYGANTLNNRVASIQREIGRNGTYGQNCVASATPQGPTPQVLGQ